MKKITSVGIIGLGSFGRFAASLVPRDADVVLYGYDPKEAPVDGVKLVDLATLAKADVVILAVPLEQYPVLLPQLQPLIGPDTLLVDVCSVKVRPAQHIHKYFPDHANLLLTHPLFGPQSAGESTKGHKLIVTESKGDIAQQLLDFCEQKLELELHNMTNEEHDQLMAQVHVLTFFVARGLSDLQIKKGPFITPSYKMIMDLVTFDQTHSDELFQTIQRGNPYAESMRQQVVQSFSKLAASLEEEKK